MARPGRFPAPVAVVAAVVGVVALLGAARAAESGPFDGPDPAAILTEPLRGPVALPPVVASGTIEVLDRLGPWRIPGGDVAALAALTLALVVIGRWRPLSSRAVSGTHRASTRSTRAPPQRVA